jgi:surface antigen
MRRPTRLLLLALTICGINACAGQLGSPGSAGPLPVYEPGETFRFADGTEFRVAELSTDRIVWQTSSGNTQTGLRDIFLPPVEGTDGGIRFSRTISGKPGELWPPAPGRTTLFRAGLRQPGAPETTELWSCTIRNLTVIEIRLGKFDAYPVACDILRGTGPGRQTETQIAYYAPRLRYFARVETQDATGAVRATDLADVLTVDTALPPSALARRDAALQAALENLPSGRDAGWRDADGATTGRVRPVRSFRVDSGKFCREFVEDTATPQRFDRNRRIACRQDEGVWVEVEPVV